MQQQYIINLGGTMNNIDMKNLEYSKETLSEAVFSDASRTRAWIEGSLDALRHNVEYLQSLLPSHNQSYSTA